VKIAEAISASAKGKIMKNHHVFSKLSSADLFDMLGLQAKPSVQNRVLTYAGFVAAGLVIGGAAALLLAPKSGRETRADIKSGAKELSDRVGATAVSAIEVAKRTANDMKNHGSTSQPIA